MCAEWKASFHQFLSDVGPKKTGDLSLDRLDNNKGYEKDNCEWRTARQQLHNRRQYKTAKMITILGESKTVTDWCKQIGITKGGFEKRLQRGLTGIELLAPPRHY